MKKVKIIDENTFLDYAGDMNIILSNRKLLDNYNDDRSFVALMASWFVNTKKLSSQSIEKIGTIDQNLKTLYALERAKCNNLDEVGHYFGCLTAEIFNISNDKQGRALSVLGYNMGKWIYTIDAFDDLKKDIKRRKYNPFIYTFEYNGMEPDAFKASILESTEFTLVKCLDEISKAFELLNIKKNREIIENIIYMGMKQKTESILRGGYKNDQSIRDLRGKGRCYT